MQNNIIVMDIAIQEIPVTAEIGLLGHTFSGLAEVELAVEVSARIRTGALGYRDIAHRTPDRPIPDVHVALLYEPYPCFDSYDYASETRRYCNYFLSSRPFTNADIERLGRLRMSCNNCLVTENIPAGDTPVLYYRGDGSVMLLARVPDSEY